MSQFGSKNFGEFPSEDELKPKPGNLYNFTENKVYVVLETNNNTDLPFHPNNQNTKVICVCMSHNDAKKHVGPDKPNRRIEGPVPLYGSYFVSNPTSYPYPEPRFDPPYPRVDPFKFDPLPPLKPPYPFKPPNPPNPFAPPNFTPPNSPNPFSSSDQTDNDYFS